MLNDFDEFVRFCFEHGATLRNHKAFVEMAKKLRASIESAQQSVQRTGNLSGLLEGEYKVDWISDDVVYLTPRQGAG